MAFGELNVAMSGLFAAQYGLSVTNTNITNMNTPGYSRQVINQEAWLPLIGSAGMVGSGVETVSIDRVRDPFLDQKYWKYNDTLGEYEIKSQQTSIIEGIFGEPAEDGFTKIYTDFFSGIDDLSKNSSATETATALRQYMISFSDYYNEMANGLTDLQSDVNLQIKTTVDNINMLANRIQNLNKQIYTYELKGTVANELRDQRELCVDELSKFINVEAKEVEFIKPDGRVEKQFQVYTNGQSLVDHLDIRNLEIEIRDTKNNERDIDGLYDIVWDDGAEFDTSSQYFSGELKGLFDMRDGNGNGLNPETQQAEYGGIPYYLNRLDEFVQHFAKELNTIYNQDANGNQLVDENGNTMHALFSYRDETTGELIKSNDPLFDYTKLNASTISISYEILADADNIRTNYEHITADGKESNPNPGNNDLLLDLLAQRENPEFFNQGTPEDYMISIFSALGVNASEAKMFAKTQNNVITEVQKQRMSVSGVDSNEEFMNLLKYNMAYQASAKVISTLDGIYDIMINRMGSW